MKRLRLWWKS